MFLEFTQGTFIWQWFHSWAGLNAMTISLIVAALVVGLTRFTPVSTCIKALVGGGTVATLPLGLSKMGIAFPVYDPQLTAYLSFFGAVAVVGLGVPYLFSQILRSTSGKNSTYTGLTGQFDNPVAATAGASANGGMGQTRDFGGDAPNQNTLNFQSGPKAGDTINIGPKTMTVGRSPDNDIVIDDPTVSRQHARITFDGNQFYVEDLNSTSGTKINGKNVAKEAIMAGATMKMGNTEIGFNNNGVYQEKFPPQSVPASGNPGETRVIGKSPASMTWLAGTAGAAAGQTCHLKEGNNTIGRDADNAVVLDDPYTSRQHAVVRVEDGKAHLFDLGSSGGTKVNGKEIGGGRVELNSVIKVGETELSLLQVDNPKQFAQATMSGNTMVDRRGEQVGVLVVKSGVDAGKSFMLSEGDNSIGRGNDAAVSLSDESVSRQHAVIRCQDSKLSLFDVGSRSGTVLNGQSIGGHLITNGDVISIGRSKFTMMAAKPEPVGV
jgi:pSer/pThr/pTyr-binding forkhead associated (FHA) protein